MIRLRSIAYGSVAMLLIIPPMTPWALAQNPPAQAQTPTPAPTPAPAGQPAGTPSGTPSGTPADQSSATQSSGQSSGQSSDQAPDLSVAAVKLENAWRASKLIGLPVYNDQQQQIGTVDDLMVQDENRIVLAVISVGGFLGIGNKLVGVPWHELHIDKNNNNNLQLMMQGADKGSLKARPTFVYGD